MAMATKDGIATERRRMPANSPGGKSKRTTLAVRSKPTRVGAPARTPVSDTPKSSVHQAAALKASHEALRERESELAAIYENAPLIMMVVDSQRRVHKVNKLTARLAGIAASDLVGRRPGEALSCVHAFCTGSGRDLKPECAECLVHRTIQETLETGCSRYQVEVNVPTLRQGQQHNLTYLLSSAVLELQGQRMALVTLEDISRRKAVEAALQQSEQEFRAIFELASIGMAQADPCTGQWLRVNEKLCAITGYSAAEMLELRFSEVTHPEDRRRDWEAFQRVVRGEQPDYRVEKRYVRKDGTVAWVNVNMTVLRDAAGRVTRTVSTIEDITERKRAEEALQKSEKELAAFFEDSPVGMLWTGPEGCIVRVNRAELELLGYPPEEVLGRLVTTFHVEPAAAGNILERLARGETVQNYSARIRHSTGSIKHVLIAANGLWERQRFIRSRWYVRDITRLIELEREILAISEREQRRLGNDLHDDLCQQLAGIQFVSQTLASNLAVRSDPETPQAREIAQAVQHAMVQTRELARGLSPVSLEADGLMAALGELAARTQRVFRIQCHFRCDRPVLVPDHSVAIHLYRIAQEAVGNAVKHGKASTIDVLLTAADMSVRLAVTDNGIGIPRRLPPQRGLGLRIMQYRAGVIGGSLLVQRETTGGTSVVCTVTDGLLPSNARNSK